MSDIRSDSPLSAPDFAANLERFTGFADLYDRYRPAPPSVLAEILPRMAGVETLTRVVDLGCGTGLSTRYWLDKAAEAIGIEPTAAMREQAQAIASAPSPTQLRYQQGFSHATGLPAACAELVTCSQSLHWMDPLPTFREAARILRPGGVFAAYDYDWPPSTGAWQADAAFISCMDAARGLEARLGLTTPLQQWDKSGHLGRMQASGAFRFAREIVVHHHDQGNAERLVGLLLSQGYINTLLKQGYSEQDLGIDSLRATAQALLGPEPSPWLWSSRVRIGVV